MTVPERIAAFLQRKSPAAFCNRCLKKQIPLKKPQQADHATTGFAEARGPFHRAKGNRPCSTCGRWITVSWYES